MFCEIAGMGVSSDAYHPVQPDPSGNGAILAMQRAMQRMKGMMPKNKLSRSMLTKLKVYAGGEHPHAAQQPTPLEI